MNVFRVIRPNAFEAFKSLSSLTSVSSPRSAVQIMGRNLVLPLAAQQRCQHNVVNQTKEQMSMFEKIKWDIGFYGKLRVPKNDLHKSGFRLYICCTDYVDFPQFVKELEIPDSFNSWFLVLQLHLWLVHVKLSQMGKEGILLTNHLYTNMWLDVERRLNTYRELLGSEKRAAMRQYHSLMCSSILYYDEGLIGTDQQLANALWTQLFSMDENVKAEQLELMVEYVRKQVYHLDGLNHDKILSPGYVNFLPLHGSRSDLDRVARELASVQNETGG